jgi:hypothetical protein
MDTIENAYEAASTMNGMALPAVSSTPPSGGPASLTAASRPVCAPLAVGSCTAGTTERIAPAYAAKNSAPAPPRGTRRTATIQTDTVSRTSAHGEPADQDHPRGVGADHQPLAVPAVGCEARRQRDTVSRPPTG